MKNYEKPLHKSTIRATLKKEKMMKHEKSKWFQHFNRIYEEYVQKIEETEGLLKYKNKIPTIILE